jgi:thiol:disulfide interchange protein DsbC
MFFVALILVATAASADSFGEFRAKLKKQFPELDAQYVARSPVPGLYEVGSAGQMLYVTEDARFAFSGRLYDLDKKEDLTEPRLAELRRQQLEGLSEDKMIVFAPAGKARFTITTFTDIDCPYCRRMHQEMAELNEAGVKVRYLFYPRAGVGSKSFDKAVAVWCADDRLDAMTRAKSGRDVEQRECDNPIFEHMALAQQMGLQGTPMSVTDSGERVSGYMPAEQLVQRLEQEAARR